MKKIAIVQNMIPHYRKPLYRFLSKEYDLIVIHSGDVSLSKDELYKEVIVGKVKLGPFFFQKKLYSLVGSNDYDAIIVMADLRWINNFLLLFYCMFKKVSYINWGHRYSKSRLVNYIRNFWLKHSNANILYSSTDLNKIVSSGADKKSLFVAENTIYVPNHECSSGADKTSFIFVGRAQKRKKIDEALIAFSQVINNLPTNTLFEIVGDGDENINLKRLVSTLGIQDKVLFHGSITSSDQLKNIFQRAYAYVSPGAVGLGVLHSLAYGVPVITYRDEYHGPEFDNLINNENSFICKDFEELSNSIVNIVKYNNYKRMGGLAYELYSKSRTIEHMKAGFDNAIAYVSKNNG